MGKAIYTGVSGIARNVKQPSIGVGGVSRNVTNGYIGVGGVARQFYQGLDTTLTISDAYNAGYWTRVAFNACWTFIEDQEDGNTNYSYVCGMHSTWGTDGVRAGGTFYSASNDFLAYANAFYGGYFSKNAFAFFCPTKNHADALTQCIINNYSQIKHSFFNWDTLGEFGGNTRNITSVSSLGLCSNINYQIPYGKPSQVGYVYNFANDSYYSSLYVVEVLLDGYLRPTHEKPNYSICLYANFL